MKMQFEDIFTWTVIMVYHFIQFIRYWDGRNISLLVFTVFCTDIAFMVKRAVTDLVSV